MTNRKSQLLWAVVLLSLAAALWWWLRPGTYPIVNEHPRGSTIIAFGDSLTSGHGAGENQGWPEQLSRRLGITIINRGISGNTTADALARLDRDVLRHDPRMVLVCLGANDYFRKRNADETFDDLRAIIGRIQRQGAMVILIGLELPLSDYGPRYRALSRQMGCPYVPDLLDGLLGRPELMADQVHPNAAGHARMAAKIEPVLKKYLE